MLHMTFTLSEILGQIKYVFIIPVKREVKTGIEEIVPISKSFVNTYKEGGKRIRKELKKVEPEEKKSFCSDRSIDLYI